MAAKVKAAAAAKNGEPVETLALSAELRSQLTRLGIPFPSLLDDATRALRLVPGGLETTEEIGELATATVRLCRRWCNEECGAQQVRPGDAIRVEEVAALATLTAHAFQNLAAHARRAAMERRQRREAEAREQGAA